jgi:hypothetical protein
MLWECGVSLAAVACFVSSEKRPALTAKGSSGPVRLGWLFIPIIVHSWVLLHHARASIGLASAAAAVPFALQF